MKRILVLSLFVALSACATTPKRPRAKLAIDDDASAPKTTTSQALTEKSSDEPGTGHQEIDLGLTGGTGHVEIESALSAKEQDQAIAAESGKKSDKKKGKKTKKGARSSKSAKSAAPAKSDNTAAP